MAVKLYANGVIDRGVDQSQAMFLALGKSHLSVGSSACFVLSEAIDENVVSVWWRRVGLEVLKSDLVDIVCKTVVPIANRESTKIDIVVRGGRTIDNDRASNTHTVLRRVMTVVPRSTELGGKECVCSGLAGRDRAFGNTTNTISTNTVELSNTMPMETAAIVLEGVLDIDNNGISPIGSNDWPGQLVVDEIALDGSIAVRVTCCVCNLKIVSNGLSCGGVLQIKICFDTVTTAPTLTRVGAIGASGIGHQRCG